jgi:hypothetical protein
VFPIPFPYCFPQTPAQPPAPQPVVVPVPHQVRAFYFGVVDSGHLFGPFSNRPEAERCAQILSGRSDVKSAKVEQI